MSVIYYKHGTALYAVKSIFKGIKMKMLEKKKGNWIVKIIAQKAIIGTVSYTLYVFDRTLKQFALIQKFDSLQEAKNYFKILSKNN